LQVPIKDFNDREHKARKDADSVDDGHTCVCKVLQAWAKGTIKGMARTGI